MARYKMKHLLYTTTSSLMSIIIIKEYITLRKKKNLIIGLKAKKF